MPKIYDNIENKLAVGLNDTLALSQRADFCVGYFNLRGWKQVVDSIDKLSGASVIEVDNEVSRICRLLVGMQKLPIDIIRDGMFQNEDTIDNAAASKLKKKLAQEFKDQLTIGNPSEADEIGLRRLSQQMKDGKVVVKLHLRYLLHAKLYLAYSQDKRVPIVGFIGSSNLTLAGLARQGELNVDVMEQDAALKLAGWFDDRWNDRWCLDITKELIEIIDTSWAADRLVQPYHIYLKIAYHLSREARAGINEFRLPKIFKDDLLKHQEKAVLIAAHHLHKRGGVVVGDVVGLGKTIVASALARIFEDDFFLETLIISPKNLVEMWEGYVHRYQLRAKVISLSTVQNVLEDLPRYRLVIIDESHNLRNDQGSRYQSIRNYIDRNECKVILLSATPYNKTYLDLSNQLRLFIPDDQDIGISPEHYIKQIGGPVQFNAQHTETLIRSIKAFEKSDFADDWRELMRLYMVRRTRSFIKNNYAQLDPANKRRYLTFADGTRSYFPDRTPKKVEYDFDPNDPTDQYAKLYSQGVVNSIDSLQLPRYGLQKYINPNPKITATKDEMLVIANLSRAGKRLMGFCRTNLFKRLESSGYSFLLSLSRHALRNYVFIYALENGLPLPIGKNIAHNLDEFIEDQDTDQSEDVEKLHLLLEPKKYLEQAEKVYKLFNSGKYKTQFEWVRSEHFLKSLKSDLKSDAETILDLMKLGKDWNAKADRQLNALEDLLTNKHPKEKVLVFTQFADTANYLVEQLNERKVKDLACVTGDVENPTEYAERFSPVSNQRPGIQRKNQELRVLVTTDVLSEGQNLQDAHIVVNFDLPWALIRLIQRAGRVDRIGQKAEEILCYSFLPEEGLNQILKLRERLRTRIQQNAEVVGSDEVFFDGDPINVEDLYNEKSGILDEEEGDMDVDLASYAYEIWNKALEKDPNLKQLIPDLPNVVYATKQNNEEPAKEGAVVYVRSAEDNDVLSWVDRKGNIITQSQLAIIKASACEAKEKPLQKIDNHHEMVKTALENVRTEEQKMAGTLGNKKSIRYRVYMTLDRFCQQNENTLFVTDELKKAVNDIFKYHLTEFARETFSRQLKAFISDNDLAQLAVSLREDDKLSIIDDDSQQKREPHIICSLGFKNV